MQPLYQDLFQFTAYVPAINLSFHQYLLATEQPVLFHTGNIHQAAALVPELKSELKGKALKYIFISHFEADECGGLSYILEHFPGAKPICSEVTARQLSGFGITNNAIIKRPGEKLTSDFFELEFLAYPSEMHLWEGLLPIENRRGIFFSSDLLLRLGQAAGTVLEANWTSEINSFGREQVADPERLSLLKTALSRLRPLFIATGHGPCLSLQ